MTGDARCGDCVHFRNDPAYLERIAREERGMVRPGETVLKFPSKDRVSH